MGTSPGKNLACATAGFVYFRRFPPIMIGSPGKIWQAARKTPRQPPGRREPLPRASLAHNEKKNDYDPHGVTVGQKIFLLVFVLKNQAI